MKKNHGRSRWVNRLAAVGAALGWTALAMQLYLTLGQAIADGRGFLGGLIVYLSFFTILTNILVALALTAPLVRTRSAVAEFFSRPSVNTGIAASIVLVGIGYTLLLQHLWDPKGMQLVADILLHHVMPVFFLFYWWLAVPKGHVRWSDSLRWMIYPVVYFLYHTIRGAVSGAYPYPFIDPSELGYARVSLNALALLLGFVAVALLLVAVGRLKHAATLGASPPR